MGPTHPTEHTGGHFTELPGGPAGGACTVIGMLSGTSHDAVDAAAATLWFEEPDTVVLRPLGARGEPFPPGLREQMAPNWHFLHVVQDVVPALLQRGVTQEQVDLMLRDNPRAFFER